MAYTAAELATLNFYNWEILGRGYYLYPYQVAIEPPFKAFKHHLNFNYPLGLDDGKVPSLIKKVQDLFVSKPKPTEELKNAYEIEVLPFETITEKVALQIHFNKAPTIEPALSLELLEGLLFSNEAISFEIIGTKTAIVIQLVCSLIDSERVRALIKAYFPTVVIKEEEVFKLPFSNKLDIAICDFGLEEEFTRPLQQANDFNIDPLKNAFATLENLQQDDIAMLQVLFKGVEKPWAKQITTSVADGYGNNFFIDAPDMPELAKKKTANGLCAAVVRIAVQANSKNRASYLAHEMINNIEAATRSPHNKLIPLSNEGYSFNHHVLNLYSRETNRLGMLLSSKELLSLVHYPNSTVNSQKLNYAKTKTKLALQTFNQGCLLGINSHNHSVVEVKLSHKQRLKHTHIIGVTGTGKSTLLANMILDDIAKGVGGVLIDPHGDITDDVLVQIPENKKQDIILIDPSDTDFPIGFNLLEAKTDIEKIVLSSDLVSAFKQQATAWGDNMSAVLTNAINTFLDSAKGGTIIELKRFLLEDSYRNEYLKTVEDVSLNYYWNHEYKMVKKGIAPLLTRIDTFLRPKLLRYMFAQKEGINFNQSLNENKTILIKLSQGLIGEENSYLLGALFLSKINQAAYNRQSIPKSNRKPYYVYIDEFQNFITPSITSMLSGARKYGIGLILAHQELSQIEDNKVLNSVLSNPYTRICFKLGDNDAKKLESGFSYFEKEDLMNLCTGEAIVRLGSINDDFNLNTLAPREQKNYQIKEEIIRQSRDRYAKSRSEINELLLSLMPKVDFLTDKEVVKHEVSEDIKSEKANILNQAEQSKPKITHQQKQELIANEIKSQSIREHSHIQRTIKRLGQQHGYAATIERETEKGGRIDVTLENERLKIACEVSVTNTPEYEIENITKCLEESYHLVMMISKKPKHLKQIEELAKSKLTKDQLDRVVFIHPDNVVDYLVEIKANSEPKTEIIKGYRVITDFEDNPDIDKKYARDSILRLIRKFR
ncbi:type IV secretory system conjugative DNA transfer family protein [Gaetbulibacter jejuensis]|uniref:type IV secretory system conjugative DNA transfer family protein n=1 Tax=Gaetbulibacter jejuensis TaxID=584607 RepID=UPI003008D2E7